jgi:hypothetical protein
MDGVRMDSGKHRGIWRLVVNIDSTSVLVSEIEQFYSVGDPEDIQLTGLSAGGFNQNLPKPPKKVHSHTY